MVAPANIISFLYTQLLVITFIPLLCFIRNTTLIHIVVFYSCFTFDFIIYTSNCISLFGVLAPHNHSNPTIIAPIISFAAPLTLLIPRMPGCMTTTQSLATTLVPSTTNAPCVMVPFSPANSLSSTLSTMCPTVLVPLVSTFCFPVITINALLVPNPISTSASLPPRFQGPSSTQFPAPLYPLHSLRLFGVAVNPHLKLQPSLLKNKTDNYVSLFY